MKSALKCFLIPLLLRPLCLHAQVMSPGDSTIRDIVVEGSQQSRLYSYAQALLDSIGPRLTGSIGQAQAATWIAGIYRKLGIPVRSEQYGTWRRWERGRLAAELTAPHLKPLEGMRMTWAVGTPGALEGSVVIYPAYQSVAEMEAWLTTIRGKFVMLSFPEPTCRPDESWRAFATPASFERMRSERAAARDSFYTTRRRALSGAERRRRLRAAGVLGVIVSLVAIPQFVDAWGTMKIGTASDTTMTELGLGCEDYGLLFRLAENDQGPLVRLMAGAHFVGEVPARNVIAQIRGETKPDEYVVLSAHMDSWDAASSATDNGAGTVVLMEAMRILSKTYPHPRRTIIAAHWSGEEQGLNGSRSFVIDHPEVVNGLQVLLNQDNGTGRIDTISMQGIAGAGQFFRRWLTRVPPEIAGAITIVDPGQVGGGTDHASFRCAGAPAFSLEGVEWDYRRYTWHTNRDTFDKLVFDDLRSNAILVAALAYLASEEPQLLPRDSVTSTGSPPARAPSPRHGCTSPARSFVAP